MTAFQALITIGLCVAGTMPVSYTHLGIPAGTAGRYAADFR